MRLLLIPAVLAALALSSLEEGNRRYAAGDYAGAAEAYARALGRGDTTAVLRYNLGTALLRLGRYEEARPHLEAAARDGVAEAVRRRGHYNGGNAHLEPAFEGLPADAERRARLTSAVREYRAALRLHPGDDDARWNLELAQRLLEETPSPAAGGGGEGEPPEGAEGPDGEGDDPAQGEPPPATAPEPRGEREVSRAEAERLLDEAHAREMEVQQRQLRREQRSVRGVRDW